MPHYYGAHDFEGDTTANCYNGHCWCNCFNVAGGTSADNTGMNSVPELTCSEEETGNQWGSVCTGACDNWCLTYDHMHSGAEGWGNISQPPRPARPRQPYTPGRGRRRRGYNKGGRVNSGRFSGRTQSNPKGKPRK